jgi:hypothetical protein
MNFYCVKMQGYACTVCGTGFPLLSCCAKIYRGIAILASVLIAAAVVPAGIASGAP